jgi:uncharacterized membrane protein
MQFKYVYIVCFIFLPSLWFHKRRFYATYTKIQQTEKNRAGIQII